MLLTSGNLKPGCQDKFIHCYLFHVDILQLCRARNSSMETCLEIPLASSWPYSLFIHQLLKKGNKLNQERICMSHAEENFNLSSTKEFSPSKLCRKYGFKTYPVSPPLRTEDLEGFSASLCTVQCLWTQLFELVDWVSCQFWYFYFAFLCQIDLRSDKSTPTFCWLVTVYQVFLFLLLRSHFLLVLISLFYVVITLVLLSL